MLPIHSHRSHNPFNHSNTEYKLKTDGNSNTNQTKPQQRYTVISNVYRTNHHLRPPPTSLLAPTRCPPDYATCLLHLTIVPCNAIISPSTCPHQTHSVPPSLLPPQQPAQDQPQSNTYHSGGCTSLSTGAIISIVIAGVALLVILLLMMRYQYKCRLRRGSPWGAPVKF